MTKQTINRDVKGPLTETWEDQSRPDETNQPRFCYARNYNAKLGPTPKKKKKNSDIILKRYLVDTIYWP